MNSPRARADLRQAKEQRLQALEMQQAQKGNDTPPHILTEIDQLRTDIDLMDVTPVSPEIIEAVPGTTGQILLGAVMKLTRDVGGLTEQMPPLKDLVTRALVKVHLMEQDRAKDAEKREERQREADKNTQRHEERHRIADKNDEANEQQLVEIKAGQTINRAITLVLLVVSVIILIVLWRVFG